MALPLILGGAALGALGGYSKGKQQQQADANEMALNAEMMRLSPWTGMNVQHKAARPDASTSGMVSGALGGGLSGLSMGQSMGGLGGLGGGAEEAMSAQDKAQGFADVFGGSGQAKPNVYTPGRSPWDVIG